MKIESLMIENISKKLNEGYELNSISIRMFKGEILGILGKMDSGVFTLSGILSGDISYDQGSISLYERLVEADSSEKMMQSGIYHITSTPKLNINFTVAESLCITTPSNIKKKWVTHKIMLKEARDILLRYRLNVDPNKKTYQLKPYECSIIEIIRAVTMNCEVIILENVLHPHAQDANKEYYRLLMDLSAAGKTIVIIGTDLKTPIKISDRIILMRDGRVDGIFHKDRFDSAAVSRMLDPLSQIGNSRENSHIPEGPKILELKNIEIEGYNIDYAFVRAGEAVGFVDGLGNAFQPVAKLLNGEEKIGKEIWLQGMPVKLRSRRDAVSNGIGYITKFNSKQMILDHMTIEDNILLMKYKLYNKFGFIDRKWCDFASTEYLEEYHIPGGFSKLLPSQVDSRTRAFIPRIKWGAVKPKLVVMFNVFANMDSMMKADVYEYIDKLRKNGVGFVFCVSAGDDLMDICDRLYIVDRDEGLRIYDNSSGRKSND